MPASLQRTEDIDCMGLHQQGSQGPEVAKVQPICGSSALSGVRWYRFNPSRAMVVALTGVLATAGCSFSVGTQSRHLESVVGYAAQCHGDSVFRRATFGLDLRFGGESDGVELGWSAITSVVPSATRVNERRAATGWKYAPPLGVTRREEDGSRQWLGWIFLARPVPTAVVRFLHRSRLGASVGLSRSDEGLAVGGEWSTVLYAEPGHQGPYLLRFSSLRPCDAELVSLEEK